MKTQSYYYSPLLLYYTLELYIPREKNCSGCSCPLHCPHCNYPLLCCHLLRLFRRTGWPPMPPVPPSLICHCSLKTAKHRPLTVGKLSMNSRKPKKKTVLFRIFQTSETKHMTLKLFELEDSFMIGTFL